MNVKFQNYVLKSNCERNGMTIEKVTITSLFILKPTFCKSSIKLLRLANNFKIVRS